MGFLNGSSSSLNATDYYNWCSDAPPAFVVWVATAILCFLLGFPASLVVLHELLQRQKQRSSSDIFMLSLTVMDLIFTANIPFMLLNFLVWQVEELRMFFNFVYTLSMGGRLFFMASVCVDCYIAVCHPIMYKTSKKLTVIKKWVAISTSFVTAGFGLVVAVLPWIITSPFIAIPFIVGLTVIMFCDISILRALRKPDPAGKGGRSIHPQKKRALYSIRSSFILTFVTYLPPVFIFSLGHVIALAHEEIFCSYTPYGYSISMTGSVILPMIYLVSVGKLDSLKNCCNKCF